MKPLAFAIGLVIVLIIRFAIEIGLMQLGQSEQQNRTQIAQHINVA